jgi:predicted nucleotidyltransferase
MEDIMYDAWIEKFKAEAFPLIWEKYRPDKFILFGSRITGNAREESDIDAIVVSGKFSSIPFVNRSGLMLRLIRFPKHVDYLCYSPGEFDSVKSTSSIVCEALTYGISLS